MMREQLKLIIEAALLAAGEPLTVDRLLSLFKDEEIPKKQDLQEIINELQQDSADRAVELIELATGYTYRVRKELGTWIGRLWEERPQRYSRTLLETLALIAYKQPITRAEIEKIRGVAVNTHTIKTLQDRNWITVVGHRDIPGKPSLYATTKDFLNHFSLKSLEELPPLSEIADLEKAAENLQIELPLPTEAEPEVMTKHISMEESENQYQAADTMEIEETEDMEELEAVG